MAYRTKSEPYLSDAEQPPHPDVFELDSALEHIAHWLPVQGPIKDFIHHNTLHAVQHLPFHEGVAIAGKMLGARSYLPLGDYQQRYQQGRITDSAIDWALARTGMPPDQQTALRETLFENDDSSHYPPVSIANQGIRNTWLTQIEVNLNVLVHPILFRLLSNFLDQGISRWTLPKAGESFWDCMLRLTQNSLLPLHPFNEPAARALLQKEPEMVISHCLHQIVGDTTLYEQYILEMLLAHPGWSGMVSMIQHNPRALLAYRNISLKELVALELALELAFLYKKRGEHFTKIASLPQLSKIRLLKNGPIRPKTAVNLKVWHEAMEWTLHSELLVAMNLPTTPALTKPAPIAQAFFCIDDRECSIRRHLEATNPAIETFGAAGFFGIDFLYQGTDDAYPVAQCPNVITPKHLITESSDKPKTEAGAKNLKNIHFSAHSLVRGWLYTQTLGLGYSVRMAWNVFRPGAKLPKLRQLSELESHSQLHLLRETDIPTKDGYLLGFSFTEMADRVAGLLTNIGLTKNFAPTVVIVAHGSSSVNNPHFAAYDCGACSGKPGAPNARAFAWMANHESVRTVLQEGGITIPESTRFIAALHNTSRDEITYFDPHLFEENPPAGLAAFQVAMETALDLNARERCRWFELSPQGHSTTEAITEAHLHVKERSTSIFEPRPEYNHSNNLYCIVGRRALTQDLFLDRRAFLHSYDPDTDATGNILTRILSAIIPVCGGINLEYLFSRIDNSVYGAGTKLPHNVIGLLGVANGVEGDLRTGLPSQMIEVHEPSRLMIVVDQSTEILDKSIAQIGHLKEWLDNEWVRCVSRHPESHALALYSAKGWEHVCFAADIKTPSASNSEAIFAGQIHTIPVHQLIREQA